MAQRLARWLWTAGTVLLLSACGGTAPPPSAPRTNVAPAPSPPPSARRGPVEVVELSWRAHGSSVRRHMRAWRDGCFQLSGVTSSGQGVQTKRKGCVARAQAAKIFGQLDGLYKTAKLAADPGYWPYGSEGLIMVAYPDARGTLWIANDQATAAAMSRVVQRLIHGARAVLREQDLRP